MIRIVAACAMLLTLLTPACAQGTFPTLTPPNQVIAGPNGGGVAALPAPRALVVPDLPFTLSGSGSIVATVTGALTNGHCVSIGSGGNIVDAGSACSGAGGGGTVNSATIGQYAIYTGATAVSGVTLSGAFGCNASGVCTLAQMPADTVKCNNTGSTANAADCTTVITGDYTSLQTSSWFSNDSPPANYIKFGDRLFGGDAAQNYPNTACGTGDWFSNFEATTSNGACAYLEQFEAIVESKTNNGNAFGGGLFAGQTKLCGGFCQVIGVMGFQLNNNTGFGDTSYAIYGECDQTVNNTGTCLAIEVDAGNYVSNAYALQPDPFQQGTIIGVQDACGSGMTISGNVFHCSAALQIVPNSAPFNVGINFLNGSVTAGAGPNGETVAIALPTTYSMEWYSTRSTVQGGFYVDGVGNLTIALAGTIKINGNSGVTCPSGINVSTFRSVDGFVTHC